MTTSVAQRFSDRMLGQVLHGIRHSTPMGTITAPIAGEIFTPAIITLAITITLALAGLASAQGGRGLAIDLSWSVFRQLC